MEACREDLTSWNKREFGHVWHRIGQLQKKLQTVEASGAATSEEIWTARSDLNLWLDVEETMWKQWSRNTWLKLGDKNTSLFHTKASNRKAQNYIMGLNDLNGVWQEDPNEIKRIATNYFSNLFTTSNPTQWEELNAVIEPIVSESMDYLLTRDFKPFEVAQTLKQMHPTTTPGPDGMPPLFYQTFWPLVGNCVTKSVLDFLNLGIALLILMRLIIFLFPKLKIQVICLIFDPLVCVMWCISWHRKLWPIG